MKYALNTLIVILMVARVGYSQSETPEIDPDQDMVSTSSFDIGILGASYTYEWKYNQSMSLRGNIGILGRVFSRDGLFNIFDAAEYFAAFRPSLGISPRLYLSQSEDKGLAFYIDPKLHYMPDWFLKWAEQNDNAWDFRQKYHSLEFNPQIGLSVGRKDFYFDFRLGYILPIEGVFESEWNGAYDVPVSTFIRVGYRF